jgi:hypothetical protein
MTSTVTTAVTAYVYFMRKVRVSKKLARASRRRVGLFKART